MRIKLPFIQIYIYVQYIINHHNGNDDGVHFILHICKVHGKLKIETQFRSPFIQSLRSAITIFPQRTTDGKHDFRIWNSQVGIDKCMFVLSANVKFMQNVCYLI